MPQSPGEACVSFMTRLEELVGEVLSHESKHQIGSLRIWPEFRPFKIFLTKLFGVRENSFTCEGILSLESHWG